MKSIALLVFTFALGLSTAKYTDAEIAQVGDDYKYVCYAAGTRGDNGCDMSAPKYSSELSIDHSNNNCKYLAYHGPCRSAEDLKNNKPVYCAEEEIHSCSNGKCFFNICHMRALGVFHCEGCSSTPCSNPIKFNHEYRATSLLKAAARKAKGVTPGSAGDRSSDM